MLHICFQNHGSRLALSLVLKYLEAKQVNTSIGIIHTNMCSQHTATLTKKALDKGQVSLNVGYPAIYEYLNKPTCNVNNIRVICRNADLNLQGLANLPTKLYTNTNPSLVPHFGPYARTQTISKSEFSTRFSPPDYIFHMHEGRLSLIGDLVPVLNQQKLSC